jgi:hypothetical protein
MVRECTIEHNFTPTWENESRFQKFWDSASFETIASQTALLHKQLFMQQSWVNCVSIVFVLHKPIAK